MSSAGTPLNPGRFREEQLAGQVNAQKWEYAGSGRSMTFKTGIINPTPAQCAFAEDVCRFLNRELGYNGRWRTVWTQPARQWQDWVTGLTLFWVPELFEAQYLDMDGNPQFVWEAEEDIYTLLEWGIHSVAEQAHAAFKEYEELIKLTDVKPHQRVNLAKGETISNYEAHLQAPQS